MDRLTTRYNCVIIMSRKGDDYMPRIIPIRDLKKTSELSRMCKETTEPIYVTKNGYGDMVIMSMEMYEKKLMLLDAYAKLDKAEKQVEQGKVLDAKTALGDLRKKYEV